MGNPLGPFINTILRFFQGIQGSYAFNLLGKAFMRLRTAVMNPFRRVIRRVQQIFNVNLISAKLVSPINAKVRKILSGEAKSPEDYFTVGRFWVSKALVYILILGACAFVFIYFNWISPPMSDTTASESLLTSVYYDYDDMSLGEYSGRANIRAAGGNVVYTGDIVNGVCTGIGSLWNQDGVLIYEGEFANNDFEGSGTLYYSSGKPQYEGSFKENQFSGRGILYYSDGAKQYEGNFENGAFSGEGALYNEKGAMIYEGGFQNGSYHGAGTSYYPSGIKRYEGEFHLGRAQGTGILYSASGKVLYEGAFARDDIQYEALLGCTLEDAVNMFRETPVAYFSDGGTSFLFERAQIILKSDCLVELKLSERTTAGGTGWYLPDEDGETLPETEESRLPETEEETEPNAVADAVEEMRQDMQDITPEEEAEMKDLPVSNLFHIYYYLSSDEWQRASELDMSAVNIIGVTSFRPELDMAFLEGYDMTPENGAPDLQECTAIERVRLKDPTAFSTITYELTTMNRSYIHVSSINLAEAIYEEVYEVEDIRYRLCYQMDEPNKLMFVTVENY